MSTLSTLLARHADALTPKERDAITTLIRHHAARDAFAYPPQMDALTAQTGFFSFTRESHAQPVHLFAQDVASLAHTRLRIFRAEPDGQGGYTPGAEIFGARISEKSLTEAALLSNRGEGAPMTITRLGDLDLPARAPTMTAAEEAAQSYAQDQDTDLAKAVEGITATLAQQPMRPTPALREAVQDLGYRIRDMRDISFRATQHLEMMSKQRTQVLAEAAHAALHAHSIIEAMANQPAALPAPPGLDVAQAVHAHPMLEAALDPMPMERREALRSLITADIRHMAQKHPKLEGWIHDTPEGPVVQFPEQRNRSLALAGFNHNPEERAHLDALAGLWNWAFNPYIEESRTLRNPTQATVSFSQRQGWLGDLHSTFPPTEGAYFSIRVQAAWPTDNLGSQSIRSDSSALVEIETTAEDLMTALRGHPEGLATPCSLRSMCGVWRPSAKRPTHALSKDIAAIAAGTENAPEIKALVQALDALTTLASAKRSGKTWQAEAEAALAQVQECLGLAQARVGQDTTHAHAHIEAEVVKSAQDILASTARGLPSAILQTLRLGR